MNTYLMEVLRYFEGYKQFTIEAENKADAAAKGRIYVRQSPLYSGGNYNLDDVKVVKKINAKKGRHRVERSKRCY